ncbi:MAG: hypothetical protein KGQ41_02335 [Alphaproteobacteria bacterium]|nr:hypothetical protein [Alphaproteobacteria bacterium]
MIWVPLSIVAAVTVAAMALLSEYQKHPTVARLFWLRFCSLAALMPVALFIEWPSNPQFYLCMVALSVLICGSDALYYGSAKDHGAGVTTRIEPLSVLMTFVAWCALTPSQIDAYAAKPLVAAGIALCFAAAGYFALRLRHCDVSFAVMKKLAPVIVIMAAVSILGKTAMDAGGKPFDAAVAYIVIQCALMLLFYGGASVVTPQFTGNLKPNRALLASAAIMAVCSVTHIATKNIAYTYVPNPAYVTVIGLTAPLFVAGFYHLAGRADDTDKVAGFGIVITSIILVVLTRF